MRITEDEKNAIVEAVKAADPDAKVWLFGSRADDGKKGGDIDIGVLSETIDVMGEIGIRQAICDKIGEQRIDIVVSRDGKEAFFRHVVMEGVPLRMEKGSVEILRENIGSLNLSLKRLMYSYEVCCKIKLKEEYSEDEFAAFEAMTARYARTTDILVNKVLRSLDVVEYIEGGTVIDAANNAEKRGLADARDIRKLKDLRNSIAHEYIVEKLPRFFGKALEYIPLLKRAIDDLNAYCAKYLADDEVRP